MKILFFIESLRAGGKERRLVELLAFLKEKYSYELFVVLTRDEIQYEAFNSLEIPYTVIRKKTSKIEIKPFIRFFKLSKVFSPDIIHVWGNLNAIYALPTSLLQRIPLINSQITNAPNRISKKSKIFWFSFINFLFSSAVVANSYAGLRKYKVPKSKAYVIHNGVNLHRFNKQINPLDIKKKYHIETPYSVIMVAAFSDNKDYDLFLELSKHVNSKRKDISFIAVGDGKNFGRINQRIIDEKVPRFILTKRISEVEAVVSVADIGVLFSPNGEGISTSIIEYLALEKPVIASDTGGNKEIVRNAINGYLVDNNRAVNDLAILINHLIDNADLRASLGRNGKSLVEKHFNIKKMGTEFALLYEKHIN